MDVIEYTVVSKREVDSRTTPLSEHMGEIGRAASAPPEVVISLNADSSHHGADAYSAQANGDQRSGHDPLEIGFPYHPHPVKDGTIEATVCICKPFQCLIIRQGCEDACVTQQRSMSRGVRLLIMHMHLLSGNDFQPCVEFYKAPSFEAKR